MPLKFTHRSENEVPTPSSSGKVNQDLMALKDEMQKLGSGMVLEIETGSEQAVRGTKMLITRAANQIGKEWQHWSVGSKVFAKPKEMLARRGRPKKTD
jgi:TusA-related sulfurtransferase